MKIIKVCTFVANYTHSCIVANNFISKEYDNAKVIYINESRNKYVIDCKIWWKYECNW